MQKEPDFIADQPTRGLRIASGQTIAIVSVALGVIAAGIAGIAAADAMLGLGVGAGVAAVVGATMWGRARG